MADQAKLGRTVYLVSEPKLRHFKDVRPLGTGVQAANKHYVLKRGAAATKTEHKTESQLLLNLLEVAPAKHSGDT